MRHVAVAGIGARAGAQDHRPSRSMTRQGVGPLGQAPTNRTSLVSRARGQASPAVPRASKRWASAEERAGDRSRAGVGYARRPPAARHTACRHRANDIRTLAHRGRHCFQHVPVRDPGIAAEPGQHRRRPNRNIVFVADQHQGGSSRSGIAVRCAASGPAGAVASAAAPGTCYPVTAAMCLGPAPFRGDVWTRRCRAAPGATPTVSRSARPLRPCKRCVRARCPCR